MSWGLYLRVSLARDDRHLVRRVWNVVREVDPYAPDLLWREWYGRSREEAGSARYPAWVTACVAPWSTRVSSGRDDPLSRLSGPIYYPDCPFTARHLARWFSRAGAYGKLSLEPCADCDARHPPSHDSCRDVPRWIVFNPVADEHRRIPTAAGIRRSNPTYFGGLGPCRA